MQKAKYKIHVFGMVHWPLVLTILKEQAQGTYLLKYIGTTHKT